MSSVMDSSTPFFVRSRPQEDGGGDTSREGAKKELSVDDIVEIFARLPIKSLMRFRCISKFWYDLILSPSFISRHSRHHRNKKAVILPLYNAGKIPYDARSAICSPPFINASEIASDMESTDSLPLHNDRESVLSDTKVVTFTFWFGENRVQDLSLDRSGMYDFGKILGCFNGVVCLAFSPIPDSYALWNPATGQVRQFADMSLYHKPGSEKPFEPFSGFCFDPVTDAFKVVQVGLSISGKSKTRVNVFSTATNSWSFNDNVAVPYRKRSGGFNHIVEAPMCVNGYMHWGTSIFSRGKVLYDMFILFYDILNEVFGRIEMPTGHSVDVHKCCVAAYKGSLALFVPVSNCDVDLWVMNDSGGGGSNQSWSKMLTYRPPIEVTDVTGFFNKGDVYSMLFFSTPNRHLYLHDPVNAETKKFWERESMGISGIFSYTESLASLY